MHTALSITLAAMLCTIATAQRGGRRDQPIADLELEHFTHRLETYEAPSLRDGKGRYVMYLPTDYDSEENSETRYPLVIWLHGMNGSLRRFHHNDGPEILDQLRADDSIPPLLFVAIDSSRRPLYLDGLPDGDWEQAICKDLVAHLETNYRVAAGREKRAIMGVSIGGMGALRIGLNNPATFGVIGAHSAVVPPAAVEEIDERMMRFIRGGRRGPGLGDILGDPVDPKKWRMVSPIALAEDLDERTLRTTKIYFDVGTDDRYQLAAGNEALHAVLEQREVEHGYELVEGGGHAWGTGSTQRQLPKSMKFVAAAFREVAPAGDGEQAASRPTDKPATTGEKN